MSCWACSARERREPHAGGVDQWRAVHAAPKLVRRRGVDRFLTADGRIDRYPARPDDRLELLALVARSTLETDEVLTEVEVNERLICYHDDVATLRRYLVDHGLLGRQPDGANYTRGSDGPPPSGW